ncbi:MAG: asparagine synthase (glutamine-hydrolyzing) [Acidobacteriota bacterium]
MCGITGWAYIDRNVSAVRSDDESTLGSMCLSLKHRGPDSGGSFFDTDVALGIRRLAVIDLFTGGQPFFSEDRSIVAVQNGEIYNFKQLRDELIDKGHHFISNSDTEVLPHLYEEYGTRMVEKLNGMFAFALWDRNIDRLFMARDRFGEKPLYYGIFGGKLIFGSELKALLVHPAVEKRLSLHALRQYLTFDYIPAPFSIFEGIFKLPAAHSLSLEGGEVTIEPYWNLSHKKSLKIPTIEDSTEELRTLLQNSTNDRLVSDVPLGVMLSGGLDSSSVAAFAQRASTKPIKTFCIGFEESSFDESQKARAVAQYLGTEHYEDRLSMERAATLLPDIGSWLDEPICDPSIIPTYLLSQFARSEVTVALGGDGADELFAGYPSYYAHKIAEKYEKIPFTVRRLFENGVGVLPSSAKNMSLEFMAKRFFRSLSDSDPVRRHISLFGSFMASDLELLLTEAVRDREAGDIYTEARDWFDKCDFDSNLDSNNIVERMQFLDLKSYLAEDILTKVDRASMSVSLEVRSPFLDRDIAEFSARLPRNFKLKCDTPKFAFGKTGKYVLKKAMSGILPDATIDQEKAGFGIPIAAWLRGKLRPLARELLSPDRLQKQGLFNPMFVQGLLNSLDLGAASAAKAVWSLLVFQIWFDNFGP